MEISLAAWWHRKKLRRQCAAESQAALETSEWIAKRNAARGERVFSGVAEPEDFVFIAPTQDTKAMMDPFYDMWVAGAK